MKGDATVLGVIWAVYRLPCFGQRVLAFLRDLRAFRAEGREKGEKQNAALRPAA